MSRAHSCLISLTIVAAAAPAGAQSLDIDIPGGSLERSIVLLGRQARVSVGLSDRALARRRVPAVRGRMTAEEALRRLLRGGGASLVRIDNATFRIVPAAPLRLARRPAPRPAAPPASPAVAEDEEVVVVGSRREAPLANYPASVTIIDGRDPEFSIGVNGSEALLRRRAEVTTTHLGPGRNKIFLRGMSESGINGVTQATVGQYLGEFRLNYNAPDPDLKLVDIQRIEILEGPQGTLYGAGTLGGIIRLLPAAPDPSATYGTLALGGALTAHGDPGHDGSATLNLPLGPDAAVRGTLYRTVDGGYIDDLRRGLDDVNRVRTIGGRVSGRVLAGDRWTLDGTLVRQRIRGDDSQYAESFLPPLKLYAALAQKFRSGYDLAGLTAHYDGGGRDVHLSLSRVRQRLFERFDAVAGTDFPLVAYDLSTRVRMLSAEARISERNDDGTGWVVGAAAFANASDQDRDVQYFDKGTTPRNALTNKVVDLALFGEAQFSVASNTTLTVGGRLMRAASRGNGLVAQSGKKPVLVEVERNQLRALPTLAIASRPRPGLLLYARFQEGYRPGGLTVDMMGVGRFDGDRVRVVEAGLRMGEPRRGPLELSLVAGLTDWRDVQGDTLNVFAEQTTTNLGDARNLFVDGSLAWRPVSGLSLDAGVVVIDSKITTGPSRGFPLPGVARFNARGAASYAFRPTPAIRSTVGISARYTGRSYLDSGITSPGYEELLRRKQGKWLDVALNGQATLGRVTASLGVTNLLDSSASRFALGTPLLLGQREFETPVRPRTIRLGLEVALGR